MSALILLSLHKDNTSIDGDDTEGLNESENNEMKKQKILVKETGVEFEKLCIIVKKSSILKTSG